MTGKDFRQQLPARVRTLLPERWQGFQHRARFSLVQFWYGEPCFHFEVWPQRKHGVLEVGLHLEHRQAARNAALHALFDRHFVEIRHELGEMWLERWDRGWHKLYCTFPFRAYDESLLALSSETLARQIVVLQPLLEVGEEGAE